MYEYKDGNLAVTIILNHVTSVYYMKGSDKFIVYLTDNGEPIEIQNKLYDDFMNELSSCVKN